jgi:hypothetical protein
MDDARFDRLARSFGRPSSRRATLRRLAGATALGLLARARPEPAAARPYSVPRGGTCFHDRQCLNDYTPPRGAGLNPEYQVVYCADNGFSYDGDFNCCRYWGGFCDIDEQCCGDLSCIGGFCGYPDAFGDVTDDILPGDGGFGSLGLGEPCGAPEQCYSGSGTETTCADNGIDYGGICCTFYGFGCGTSRHCCGSLVCLGGVCTVPYEGLG